MKHQTFASEQDADGVIPAAIATLQDILGGLEAQFLPAGTALAELVETIETVVHGLDDVQQAFASSEGRQAIEAMLAAADRLVQAPQVQAERRVCFEELRGMVQALTGSSHELDQVMFMLQFYSMNIKIAAAGLPEFISFADEMRNQLQDGRNEVAGFKAAIARLLKDINGLQQADGEVARECARIIPQVPDRLREAARSLLDQQQKLAEVARTSGEIAALVKQRIVAALSAIQVGDSARQRIEHVVAGCRMADAALGDAAQGQGGAAAADAARFAGLHILHLCRAQLESIRGEFALEAGQLLESLRDLVPHSTRLLDFLNTNATLRESGGFIGALEAAIGQTCALTDQLRIADEEADTILRSAMATVETITNRVDRVQDLGLEVGYMSINATLRCRRNQAISQPISVIAREIKSHSGLISEHTTGIVDQSARMQGLSARISGLSGAGLESVASALDGSLACLRNVADRTAAGIGQVGVNASDMAARIGQTAEEMAGSLKIGAAIDTVIRDLSLPGDTDIPAEPLGPDHPLRAMMDQLKASYTMAAERAVHNRFLIGDMTGCTVDESPSAGDLSDDDLFDDALF